MKNYLAALSIFFFVATLQAGISFSQSTDEVANITEIVGEVVDSSGQPLESFEVTIKIYDYSKGWGKQPEVIAEWKSEFSDGEYQFDVDEPLPAKENVYVSRTVKAEGYISTDRNAFRQLRNFKGRYDKLKMYRGVKLTGKIVMPDSQSDEPLIGPRVGVIKKMKGMVPDFNNMFRGTPRISADGSFEVVVPEDCGMIVIARSENAATFKKNIKVKKFDEVDGQQDLGELKLLEGVRVSGTVLSKEGDPVKGQVVKITQTAANSGYMAETVDGYAVTDEDGKFTLPPRIGKSKIFLADAGSVDGKQVKVTGKKLSFKPIELTLEKGKLAENIELREANTWTVHGFIYNNEDGENNQPTVYASVPGESQLKVELDGNGRFEFEMPDGVQCYLMIYSSGGDTRYMAQMSPDSVKENRKYFLRSPANESQFFHFKKISCDIGPLEFELVKHMPDERTMSESLLEWLIYGN